MSAQKSNNKDLRFFNLISILSITLNVIMIALIIFFNFMIIEATKNNVKENRSIELSGLIAELNEKIEMSVMLAAYTGNVYWEKRHKDSASKIDNAVKELYTLSQDKPHIQAVQTMALEDDKFDALENKVLELVKQNKLNEAQKIIYDSQYLDKRDVYINYIQSYLRIIQKNTVDEYNESIRMAGYLSVFVLIAIIILFLSRLLTFRLFQSWQKSMMENLQIKSEYEAKLKKSYDILEKRVQDRTSELSNKNEQLTDTLKKLQEAQINLVQSEKMAMVGQLSSGIAHEINNPLSFIMSNIAVLQKRIMIITQLVELYQNLTNEIKESHVIALDNVCNKITTFKAENKIAAIFQDFNDIVNETNEGLIRIKNIVANMSSFSNVRDNEITPINLNTCINDAIEIVWNKLKYKNELHKNLADLPTINASSDQFKTIFMNLLLNASEAIKEKGEISIVSKVIGNNIIVTISDNGCGIAPENMSKLFTPFFTTKPVGIGTGMGLATSFGIIKRYGGDITAQSTLGKGTVVTLTIPIKNEN